MNTTEILCIVVAIIVIGLFFRNKVLKTTLFDSRKELKEKEDLLRDIKFEMHGLRTFLWADFNNLPIINQRLSEFNHDEARVMKSEVQENTQAMINFLIREYQTVFEKEFNALPNNSQAFTPLMKMETKWLKNYFEGFETKFMTILQSAISSSGDYDTLLGVHHACENWKPSQATKHVWEEIWITNKAFELSKEDIHKEIDFLSQKVTTLQTSNSSLEDYINSLEYVSGGIEILNRKLLTEPSRAPLKEMYQTVFHDMVIALKERAFDSDLLEIATGVMRLYEKTYPKKLVVTA